MRIINSRDIMETIEMLTAENLDVRTVTMGISLLDCIDPDADKACEKIYNKITRLAGNLVSVVDGISAEYGIPIVNKRISVTPIAMLLGAAPDADPVQYAKTLDRAAKAVGVNFIGGFGALVAAMSPPDRDIFLRKYYLLQSGKEIAAALGMSVESVNTRLSRGRDRLRRELTEKGVYSHA